MPGQPAQRLGQEFDSSTETVTLEWATLHKEELRENWARARRRESLNRIAPLE